MIVRERRNLLDEGYPHAASRFDYFNAMRPAYIAAGAETSIKVVHDGGKALFKWRGRSAADVEMDVSKYARMALLTNLVAVATDDNRNFYEGRLVHYTASKIQAVERVVLWGLFMPGDYELELLRFYRTKGNEISQLVEARSRFGRGGLKKIERESFAHYFALGVARRLAGTDDLGEIKGAQRYIQIAAWLGLSSIFAAPEGKRPSDGLELLVKRRVLPRDIYFKIRVFFYDLDWRIGAITADDKKYVLMRLVDYDGNIDRGRLVVSSKRMKNAELVVDGAPLRMGDVIEAAAKEFSRYAKWTSAHLFFGYVKDFPGLDSVPSLKYFAYLRPS